MVADLRTTGVSVAAVVRLSLLLGQHREGASCKRKRVLSNDPLSPQRRVGSGGGRVCGKWQRGRCLVEV